MKVSELIAKLLTFDQNLLVMTAGFDESGLDHIGEPGIEIAVRVVPEGGDIGHGSEFDTIRNGRSDGRTDCQIALPIGDTFPVLVIDR